MKYTTKDKKYILEQIHQENFLELFSKLDKDSPSYDPNLFQTICKLYSESYITKPGFGSNTVYTFVGCKLTEKGEIFLKEQSSTSKFFKILLWIISTIIVPIIVSLITYYFKK